LWIPDIAERAERVKTQYVAPTNRLESRLERNFGFNNSRDSRSWQATLYNKKTAEMINPQVNWTLAGGSRRWLYAERAVRTNGVWVFLNAREYGDAANTNTPPVPVLQTNVLPMPAFSETPREINSELRINRRLSLRNARGGQDIPLSEIFDYLRFHPKPSRADQSWIYTNLHSRFAAPWVCVVVVIIALPFGAAPARRNIFAGVAGSVFICFAYFTVRQLGYALGAAGHVAPWLAAWLPNLIFGIAGGWLTTRVR
jgi:lipopolysaccharide export system permease protein